MIARTIIQSSGKHVTCECIQESVEDNGNCYLKKVDECEVAAQCTGGEPGEHSECRDNGVGSDTCQCKTSAVEFSNKCYLIAVFGQACEVDAQCTARSSGNYGRCDAVEMICGCIDGAAEVDGINMLPYS